MKKKYIYIYIYIDVYMKKWLRERGAQLVKLYHTPLLIYTFRVRESDSPRVIQSSSGTIFRIVEICKRFVFVTPTWHPGGTPHGVLGTLRTYSQIHIEIYKRFTIVFFSTFFLLIVSSFSFCYSFSDRLFLFHSLILFLSSCLFSRACRRMNAHCSDDQEKKVSSRAFARTAIVIYSADKYSQRRSKKILSLSYTLDSV